MSGNPAYSSHFPSSWVAQCDEDAEPSRPSTPTQPPEQKPLHASSLTPSPDAIKTSSQFLTYFPTSWVLTSSSTPSPSPSPSSFPTPLLPMSNPTNSSVISQKISKPQRTYFFSTLGPHSSLHNPLRPERIESKYSILSQTTLRPDNTTLSPTSRTSSRHHPPELQSPLVQRHDADWIKAAEKRITAQLSPSLGQGRQANPKERDLMRRSPQTLLQDAPSWVQLQQDLQRLGLNDALYQGFHAINDDIDSLERIEEDEMDERYGDMPHRAPAVSTTYST